MPLCSGQLARQGKVIESMLKIRNLRKPAGFDQLDLLARRYKDCASLREVYLSYSHNDGLYRLTALEWTAKPGTGAAPVFEDRGFSAGELTDRLQRDIGLLELEFRMEEEDCACRRYRPEFKGDFLDDMAAPGDQAMINMLARQIDL